MTTGAQAFASVKTFNNGVTIGGGSGAGAFVNNGTTLNTVLAITDRNGGSGLAIGSAASTVDLYTAFVITQTTANQTVTIPSPSVTTAGRVIYISSSSSSTTSFTLLGSTINAGTTATLFWNGAAWTFAGADGNAILNQTLTYQNASFKIGGTGTVGTTSTAAFNVQNAAGADSLTIDTQTGTNGNLAVNGGGETSGTFASNWTQHGTATIAQTTTSGEYASGTAGVRITTSTANSGVRNNLGAALTANTTYTVSFSVKSNLSWTTSDLVVEYYRNNTPTLDTTCTAANQITTITSSAFVKYTCSFTTSGTAGNTTAFLTIRQTAATARIIYLDNLSIAAQNTTGAENTNRLRVGGESSQGLTIFTLDRSAGPPQAAGTGSTLNPSMFGSMYFDTSLGRIQCYESSGWGSCGNAPDVSVNLIPEYTGAVLNGTGVGTMIADLCSGSSRLNINATVCGSTEDYNYYRWTSPQATNQTYSVYLRYQLPATFKNFADQNTITLTARTSSTPDGSVAFTMYKPDGTLCGTSTTVTSSANTWQTVSLGGDETTCSLAANNIVLFKIDVTARNNAFVYASNLSFLTKGQ
jgi:hypothetical protein